MTNRKFKFRVWDVLNKAYLNPSDIAINGNGNLLISTSGWYEDFQNQNSSDYVIQQYTGLKDSKGKQIYEGDIFKSSAVKTWGPVEFKDGQWQANLKGARVYSLHEMFDGIGPSDYPEVIGNIFESEMSNKTLNKQIKK
jgi:uncharacterized phage protein (TIGR01671 family)